MHLDGTRRKWKGNQCSLLEVVRWWKNFFISIYVKIGCAMKNNQRLRWTLSEGVADCQPSPYGQVPVQFSEREGVSDLKAGG